MIVLSKKNFGFLQVFGVMGKLFIEVNKKGLSPVFE